MSVEVVLKDFLHAEQAKAIALVGTWGRGKTRYWRELVAKEKGGKWRSYSYVSLFGINNLDDLKYAIFEGARDLKAGNDEQDELVGKAKAFFGKKWRKLAGTASEVDTPWAGNLKAVFRAFAFSSVKNRLICLDDLERRGTGLELEDVLGLVTFLCEERSCGIVLILNDTTLEPDEQAKWDRHREKVFHGEVTYQPSSEHCISLIFDPPGEDPWQDAARVVLRDLDVGNMRIIGRVKAGLKVLSDSFPDCSPSIRNQLAASFTVLTYFHNASGEGAPSISYALKHARYRSAEGNERTTEEARWDSILESLKFYPDEVDLAIAEMVQHGYPDMDTLSDVIARNELHHEKLRNNTGFSDAWNMFHDSFDDNEEALVEKFQEIFPGAASSMNAMNANSSILLMRSLGRDDVANEFIKQWVEPRRGARHRELDLRAAEMFGPITDATFRGMILDAFGDELSELKIDDALKSLSESDGDLQHSMYVLTQAQPAEIAEWMRKNPGTPTRNLVKQIIMSRDGADARVVMRNALQLIADSSTINRVRIERYMAELG